MKQAPNSPESSLIAVQVRPKAGREGIEGEVVDSAGKKWLKVNLTVAPEDGKANKALLKLLAKEWGCAPSSLSIVSGETSRHKMIKKEI